ncbi:hypothetical protein ScPMuIL_004572 [Solemya velum]
MCVSRGGVLDNDIDTTQVRLPGILDRRVEVLDGHRRNYSTNYSTRCLLHRQASATNFARGRALPSSLRWETSNQAPGVEIV